MAVSAGLMLQGRSVDVFLQNRCKFTVFVKRVRHCLYGCRFILSLWEPFRQQIHRHDVQIAVRRLNCCIDLLLLVGGSDSRGYPASRSW